jgi:hypothetical protein
MTPLFMIGDTVCQRQRLDLVVGDVDHRVLQRLMQPLDFDAQLRTQLGVEVGQRFVEQEHVDIAHQARPIATRWRWPPESSAGLRFRQRLDLQDFGGARHALVDLRLRHLGNLQAEGQVPSTVICG